MGGHPDPPAASTPGKDPIPIVQEAGWSPGQVWTGGKSRPHRDSIPDRPAHSQSLYRPSYPAPGVLLYLVILLLIFGLIIFVTVMCFFLMLKKGKSVPLQAWSGPEVSGKLNFPDFMTMAQDGGKVVNLTHRPPLPPGNVHGTHFC